MRLVRSSKQTTGTLKLFSGSAGIPGQDSPAPNQGARSPPRRRHGEGRRGGQFRQHLKVSLFARTHTHTHTRPPGPARGRGLARARGADLRRLPCARAGSGTCLPRRGPARSGRKGGDTTRVLPPPAPQSRGDREHRRPAPLPAHARPGAAPPALGPRRPTAPGRPRARPRGRQGRGRGPPARRTYHGTDGGEFGDRH